MLMTLIKGGLLMYGFRFLNTIVKTIGKCYIAKITKDYTNSQTKSLAQMFTKTKYSLHK